MNSLNEDCIRFHMKAFSGLYARNLGANLLGFAIVVTLNIFTPLEFFKVLRTFIFLEGHWKVFFLFILLSCAWWPCCSIASKLQFNNWRI